MGGDPGVTEFFALLALLLGGEMIGARFLDRMARYHSNYDKPIIVGNFIFFIIRG